MENFVKFWPLLLLFIVVGVVKIFVEPILREPKGATNLSEYEKKPYLFDTNSEFALYKILLELFGEQYHIFPQINYSHLVIPKITDWKEKQALRSRIDRKSADFVFCDKQSVVPVLVIEQDGSVHTIEKKQLRDEKIDNILDSVGLPILHLHTNNLDKESIRSAISQKLSPTS